MSTNLISITGTALAQEVNLISPDDHLNNVEMTYCHGTGCGGSCCRDKEPGVKFSGRNDVGERIEFICHVEALNDLFKLMDGCAGDGPSDYLLRKLGQSIVRVK